MSIIMPAFTDGSVVKADEIHDRIDDVENYINGGATSLDLQQTSAWVDTQHIFKPEFYGSPSPRCEAISARTHYRVRSNDMYERSVHHTPSGNQTYRPVEGLTATVKVPDMGGSVAYAAIICSFSTYERDGRRQGVEDKRAAVFALFVDGTKKNGTERAVYCNASRLGERMLILGRHQHNMVYEVDLAEGVHHIEVRVAVDQPNTSATPDPEVYGTSPGDQSSWEHIIVEGRSLVVDLAVK